MWNNVLHGFSFVQSKHLLQLFVLILRILSVITLYFDMIKKKNYFRGNKKPQGGLNKGNSERNRISRKILLCCFWSITACNRCVIILSLFSDIDECTSKTHNCDRNALCKNTEGSFTCTCNRGYKGDGKNCKGIFLALL